MTVLLLSIHLSRIYIVNQCKEGQLSFVILCTSAYMGRMWRIGRDNAFRPKGRGFDTRSSRQVGTLGKFLTHNCLWRFGVKLRHSICAMSVAPMSSSGLEEVL